MTLINRRMASKTFPPKAGVALPDESCPDIRELANILLFLQRSFLTNLSRELSAGNVSFAQFFLLTALAGGEALTMSEIAARMRHTTAAATGLVDRLEALVYVERAHSLNDRRKVMVKITENGSALVARIKEDMVHNLTALMTYLTSAEQKAWVQVYRKIYDVIQSQPPC
jgi:DNA-binding MarR family transcriptional regulator